LAEGKFPQHPHLQTRKPWSRLPGGDGGGDAAAWSGRAQGQCGSQTPPWQAGSMLHEGEILPGIAGEDL